MKEDLLHFIWKYKKLPLEGLLTAQNEEVLISDVGTHNFLSGPDFFNAKLQIDNQLWAGNVEIHVKSSDWYAHHHETDDAYNNVILHVVWENDAEVFRSDNTKIPALELKNYISKSLLKAYQNLFDKKEIRFINCEKDIAEIEMFVLSNWLERLYFERLEQKSLLVHELLAESHNDWEKTLFTLLFKNFGLKINADAFLSVAKSINFSVVRKTQNKPEVLESIFLGQAGLLESEDFVDVHFINLKKEYQYTSHKFGLDAVGVQKPEFFKLRPPNFPTIRLSQLANLYSMHQSLFEKIIVAKKLEDFYEIFTVTASEYWTTHYVFGKESKKSIKKLTKKFIDLLIINTILPIKFCYAKSIGKDVNEELIKIITDLKSENNTILENFYTYGVQANSAKESQAILQLYNNYCTKNRCLQCAIGSSLLVDKT